MSARLLLNFIKKEKPCPATWNGGATPPAQPLGERSAGHGKLKVNSWPAYLVQFILDQQGYRALISCALYCSLLLSRGFGQPPFEMPDGVACRPYFPSLVLHKESRPSRNWPICIAQHGPDNCFNGAATAHRRAPNGPIPLERSWWGGYRPWLVHAVGCFLDRFHCSLFELPGSAASGRDKGMSDHLPGFNRRRSEDAALPTAAESLDGQWAIFGDSPLVLTVWAIGYRCTFMITLSVFCFCRVEQI